MLPITLGLIVFILDLGTKFLVMTRMTEFETIPVISGFFSIQFVYNPGAAFGMLANQQWLFITVTFVAIGAMLYFLRQPDAKHGVMPWAIGLLLGGTIGNLIDRIRLGKVVDFLLFYWRDYLFPNFNVADIAITAGVGLFILHLMLNGEDKAA